MSPWDGIQEFVMVVETGSFTIAAKRLGVSAAHVSRQVARLEDRVNVKLLAGRIRVSAAGAFAEERVAPVLARFAAEHPRISIEMDFNSRFVDLVDQGFDFAVRYGVLVDSSLIAHRLSPRSMVCAAAPDYLVRHGEPKHPSELRGHACLITNSDHRTFTDPDTDSNFDVRVTGPWRANNGPAVRYTAIEGLGIAYAPLASLRIGLEDDQIVPILEAFQDRSRSSWIVYPERRHMPIRVRKAIDYLIAAFAE